MTKILVIEDEKHIRENILDLLADEGFDAIGAENGKIGLQLAQQEIPDLIVSDVLMPQLNGYGVLTAIRSNPVTATIPFIFLTAKADKTDIRHGMELGADDYLTKPFTADELLAAIAARLDKQAALDLHSQQKLEDLRSNISITLPHELHTPLNGILACSQLLIDEAECVQPQEILEMAGDIRTSAFRLYKLVQNFLLYAQLELLATNPEQIEELRQSSRTESVKTAIAQVAIQKAKQANREVDLELDLQDSAVCISETKLRKVVEELLDNACKFSPAGTAIRVATRCEGKAFVLSVSDKGQGMSAEAICQVGAYMRFERKLSSQQGTGLGLSIVKRIAQLLGGELEIESTPGVQTCVRVILLMPT